jgi:hypothetical protein
MIHWAIPVALCGLHRKQRCRWCLLSVRIGLHLQFLKCQPLRLKLQPPLRLLPLCLFPPSPNLHLDAPLVSSVNGVQPASD